MDIRVDIREFFPCMDMLRILGPGGLRALNLASLSLGQVKTNSQSFAHCKHPRQRYAIKSLELLFSAAQSPKSMRYRFLLEQFG